MKIKRILSAVLCLCTLLACLPAAFADGTDAEEMKIFNDSEIENIIKDYLSSRSISAEKVSIGFCYTATGDEWFMNGDESASERRAYFFASARHASSPPRYARMVCAQSLLE